MSRDHHPPLRDVTADTENTDPSTVACWTVFTELLPGNALIKSVILY
jgi:nanoRNase/pAp phosphatase (c-di-AMP/oligoRNAs hydrolase)